MSFEIRLGDELSQLGLKLGNLHQVALPYDELSQLDQYVPPLHIYPEYVLSH